ncbi:hypothetical protein [Reinekea sp. G2M2-21]|uniref:hypothetical protein n=1 Tax=Reinekea sp. G2M2-21 TaxID=2788942 RepID=UPI0018AC2143|nr:hypothetical protein [Reinekea sp. G2M2-21]
MTATAIELSERLQTVSLREGFEILTAGQLGIAEEDMDKYKVEACYVSARVRDGNGKVVTCSHRKVPIAFLGKGQKDILNSGYFQTVEELVEFVSGRLKNRISNCKSDELYKERRKAEAQKLFEETEPGDIFYTIYGYEQTNVDYYQVIGKRGKATLVFRELNQERNYTQDMSGDCTPVPDSFMNDKQIECRIGNGVTIEKQNASPLSYHTVMDGAVRIYDSKYFSTYA